MKKKDKRKRRIFWLRVLLIIVSLVIYVGVAIYFADTIHEEGKSRFGSIAFGFLAGGFVILPFVAGLFYGIGSGDYIEEYPDEEHTETKGTGNEKDLSQKEKEKFKNITDIYESVQVNIQEIQKYIKHNQRKAKSFFWFCIGTFGIGFVVIIYGIIYYYIKNTTELQMALVSFNGIIIEFVAALLFKFHGAITKESNHYFDELIKSQDALIARNMANEIKDETKKNDLIGDIINSLLNKPKKISSK